jgi:hypothetical protein
MKEEEKLFVEELSVHDILTDTNKREFNSDLECSGCPDKVLKALTKLKNSIIKNQSKIMDKQSTTTFKLKGNPRIYSTSKKCVITSQTMTDEIALELLAESKANERIFEQFPSGYDPEASREDAAALANAAKAKRQEAKKNAKEKTGEATVPAKDTEGATGGAEDGAAAAAAGTTSDPAKDAEGAKNAEKKAFSKKVDSGK